MKQIRQTLDRRFAIHPIGCRGILKKKKKKKTRTRTRTKEEEKKGKGKEKLPTGACFHSHESERVKFCLTRYQGAYWESS